jgi:hypothetical protein
VSTARYGLDVRTTARLATASVAASGSALRSPAAWTLSRASPARVVVARAAKADGATRLAAPSSWLGSRNRSLVIMLIRST